ncbi:MAG: nucleoside triphosphate pyrophosphohydrolase family protein [Nitrospirota bacterium]
MADLESISKNLTETPSIEAGELLENFLRETAEQSRNLSTEERKNVKKNWPK